MQEQILSETRIFLLFIGILIAALSPDICRPGALSPAHARARLAKIHSPLEQLRFRQRCQKRLMASLPSQRRQAREAFDISASDADDFGKGYQLFEVTTYSEPRLDIAEYRWRTAFDVEYSCSAAVSRLPAWRELHDH